MFYPLYIILYVAYYFSRLLKVELCKNIHVTWTHLGIKIGHEWSFGMWRDCFLFQKHSNNEYIMKREKQSDSWSQIQVENFHEYKEKES